MPKYHELFKENYTYLFSKLAFDLRNSFADELSTLDFIPPYKAILTYLSKFGGVNQNELCQQLDINKATMVRFIDDLENKKCVVRTDSKTDRREKLIKASPKGLKILKTLTEKSLAIEDHFFEPLNKQEKKQLLEILQKLSGF